MEFATKPIHKQVEEDGLNTATVTVVVVVIIMSDDNDDMQLLLWMDEEFAEENARDARLKAVDDGLVKAAEEAKAKRLSEISAIEIQNPEKAARMRARAALFEAEKIGYAWKCSEALSMYADDFNGSWVPVVVVVDDDDIDNNNNNLPPPPGCGEGGYPDTEEEQQQLDDDSY